MLHYCPHGMGCGEPTGIARNLFVVTVVTHGFVELVISKSLGKTATAVCLFHWANYRVLPCSYLGCKTQGKKINTMQYTRQQLDLVDGGSASISIRSIQVHHQKAG